MLLPFNCMVLRVKSGAYWRVISSFLGRKPLFRGKKAPCFHPPGLLFFSRMRIAKGRFLGCFLVKKLDIFSLHATGEAYLFLRWCQSLYKPLFYKDAWRYRCVFERKDDESKTTLTCVNHFQMTRREMRCIEIFLLYLQ